MSSEEEQRAAEFRRQVRARIRWREGVWDRLPGPGPEANAIEQSVQPLRDWVEQQRSPADDPWEDL